MSLGDALDFIEAQAEIRQEKIKDDAYTIYKQAELFRIAVGSVLSKEIKFPSIAKAFPEVFKEEQEKATEKIAEKKTSSQMELYKAQLLDYALRNNERRRKNDTGGVECKN